MSKCLNYLIITFYRLVHEVKEIHVIPDIEYMPYMRDANTLIHDSMSLYPHYDSEKFNALDESTSIDSNMNKVRKYYLHL